MNVVLTHPVHGAKIATMKAELDTDLAKGWEVYVPPVVKPEKKGKDAPTPAFLSDSKGK